MKDWEEQAILQQYRQEQRKREMIARYASVAGRQQALRLARIAQERIIRKIEQMGFIVHQTTPNAPWDLWVGGCRVEAKASNWQQKAQRYQANVRHHQADVVIFDAINGTDHYFIIPMQEIQPRKSIEVYSYDVLDYSGQWAEYLEQWDVLIQAIEATTDQPQQLSFLDNNLAGCTIPKGVSQ